jgi:hypothetical protein
VVAVETVRSFWITSSKNRTIAILAGLGLTLLGVAVIAIGEVMGWGWTRIVGAGAISVFAIYVGALVGWSDPARPKIAAIARSWSRAILVALTAIMVAPMLAGLIILPGGAIVGGIDGSWYLVLAGILLALFLLMISAFAIVHSFILADRGLWRARSTDNSADSSGAQP